MSTATRTLLWLAPLLGVLTAGCTTVTEPDMQHATVLEPVQAVAADITLKIYSDGWGNLLETRSLATEGPVTLDVAETDPYSDPPQYYAYASAPGFFTELFACTKGETIDVDLDAVPDGSSGVAGTMFATQSFFAPSYLDGQLVEVQGPNGWQATFTTDAQGRYAISDLPAGEYSFAFDYVQFEGDAATTISLELGYDGEGVDYLDLFFAEPAQAS
jgi:hypothetical protein